jgi:hypothetical protein
MYYPSPALLPAILLALLVVEPVGRTLEQLCGADLRRGPLAVAVLVGLVVPALLVQLIAPTLTALDDATDISWTAMAIAVLPVFVALTWGLQYQLLCRRDAGVELGRSDAAVAALMTTGLAFVMEPLINWVANALSGFFGIAWP